MDFKTPKIRCWFLTEITDEDTSAELFQVEIFEDYKRSKLVIKKDEFVGVFESVVELNQHMSIHNLRNIETIDYKCLNKIERRYLHSNKTVQNVCRWILSTHPNIDLIRIHFVKENLHTLPKVVKSIKFIIIDSFNEVFQKTKNAYLEFIKLYDNLPQIPYSESKYTEVKIDNWSELDRLQLFTSALNGILYFYEIHTNRKSFDLLSYNSTMEAVQGKKSLLIYDESVKWFDKHSKNELNKLGYNFPGLITREYYYEDDECFNNKQSNDEYYNDNLDMDQQSPEFWDSL